MVISPFSAIDRLLSALHYGAYDEGESLTKPAIVYHQ